MNTLDDAYANGPHIPRGEEYPARWETAARAFRAAHPPRMLRYGDAPRETCELYLPEGASEGLMVFVHGGFWRAFDSSVFSHLAAGALARGWAVMLPTYTLCPEARIAGITREIAAAVVCGAGEVGGPVALSGHSAGGHLVARMTAPGMLPGAVAARLSHVMPISPLSDLAPLMQTAMNDDFKLDAAEARAESPRYQPAPQVPVTIWVGAAERPAFLDQARWLADAWGCGHVIAPGRHHFDVIEPLEDGQSDMMARLLAPVSRA